MERIIFPLQIKAADDEGVIEGYGSVFGNVDQGGDIVAPGAFADSLASGRVVKMLRDHDLRKVIGVWDEVTEDGKGLRVKGRMALATQLGRETFELIKMRAMDGLSIGYRTIDDAISDGVRTIKSAELWEVSATPFPMNAEAVIDMAKAEDLTERELERKLTQGAGLSRSVARALMRGGYKALTTKRDAGSEEAQKLKAALLSLSQA